MTWCKSGIPSYHNNSPSSRWNNDIPSQVDCLWCTKKRKWAFKKPVSPGWTQNAPLPQSFLDTTYFHCPCLHQTSRISCQFPAGVSSVLVFVACMSHRLLWVHCSINKWSKKPKYVSRTTTDGMALGFAQVTSRYWQATYGSLFSRLFSRSVWLSTA